MAVFSRFSSSATDPVAQTYRSATSRASIGWLLPVSNLISFAMSPMRGKARGEKKRKQRFQGEGVEKNLKLQRADF